MDFPLRYMRQIPSRGLWLAAMCCLPMISPPAALAQDARAFEFVLKDNVLGEGPQVVRVKFGEKVLLNWRADTVAEVHLHGYDKVLKLTPGKTAVMELECSATGRFPFTLHGGNVGGHAHKPLAYLEVHPK
jgi:hypothetical protein